MQHTSSKHCEFVLGKDGIQGRDHGQRKPHTKGGGGKRGRGVEVKLHYTILQLHIWFSVVLRLVCDDN